MINWKQIGERISETEKSHFSITQTTPLSGGDSNQAWHLRGCFDLEKQGHETHYFVKLNSVNRSEMFAAESAGLAEIAASQTIRVPRTITHGLTEQRSFLVLEYFNLATSGDNTLLGNQLAAMHRIHNDQFGWSRDNTIGVTPQHNNCTTDWISFWREKRLIFQLDLAAHNGYGGKLQVLGKQVLDALPDLFADHVPQPSLLHGDLWAGNHAFLADGTPLIFDPATYYGDRETDIAMTELFGGFAPDFYTAYQQAYPLDAGYATRKTLYNLYQVLNHCNMVSSSYVPQAERMMRALIEKR